jgi:hypothetical protein
MRAERLIAGLTALVAIAATSSGRAAPVGTAFTYQGRLADGGSPASGTWDFQFTLHDAAAGGGQVGPVVTRDDVTVSGGVFTVALDFGAVFDGNARFLEIGVRDGAGGGAYTMLSPRQELPPAPHALWSAATGDPGVQRRTVAPTCPAGQYLRSIAANGMPTCAPDVDTNAGGTVTSVTAGPGLTGGTITLSGTIAVSFAGTGSASTVARSDHDHDAAYQAAISGTCGPGSGIRQVNPDGSVVCEGTGVRPGASAGAVDTAGFVGLYTAIAIGADGLGLVSYSDTTNGDLKVAHCDGTACTSVTVRTVDSAGNVGTHTSSTLGTDGRALIAYHDEVNRDLKVAHCDDAECASATISTIDGAVNVGRYTSITIGADGLGLISYFDETNGDLKVAHCNDAACTSAAVNTLDSAGIVGVENTSVTIGADGLGLISYHDGTNTALKVAHCDTTDCATATVNTLDPAGGSYTSIALGADGLGLISYRDESTNDLKVAHCDDAACATATLRTLDSAGDVGYYTSVRIGADGLGLISYWDGTNGNLKVAHCADLACASATLSVLDSAGVVGEFTSLAIGADGLGLVSYHDNTNRDLKVAHCGNVPCNPFVARGR